MRRINVKEENDFSNLRNSYYKMKVLIIATGFYTYGYALKCSLEKLGYSTELVTMDLYPNGIKKKIHFKMYNILNRKFGKEVLYISPKYWRRIQSKKVYNYYREYNPDVIICFPAYDLLNDTIIRMKSSQKVMWIYDGVDNIPGIIDKAKMFDKVFVFERNDVEKLRKQGIDARFLPLCADDIHYKNLEFKEKDIDVSFVGKISYDRYIVLSEIIKKFPEYSFKFCGTYSKLIKLQQNILPWKRKELRCFTGKNISPDQANYIYNKSKICINIHKAQSQYGGNMRLFETMASCAFQITDFNEFIYDEFKDSVIIYDDIYDLIDKIAYYINHDLERDNMAEKGFEKVVKEHLFINRAQEIMKCIDSGK